MRQKPDLTAADGVATTLPGASGLNPFYGTSAAAPHAAAIAALVKQAVPTATPAQVGNFLKATALDIMTGGIDSDSGVGIVQAFQAVTATGGTPQAIVTPNGVTVNPSGNRVLEPNECNTLSLPLINVGPVGATVVGMTLATTTPGVEITKAFANYPNLVANGGNAANATPFEVTTSGSLACLGKANFTQTVTFSGGVSPRTYNFSLPIGIPAQYGFAVQSGAAFPGGAAGPIAGSVVDDGVVNVVVPAGFNFTIYGIGIAGGTMLQASTNGNVQFVASGGSDEATNLALPAGLFGPVPVVFRSGMTSTCRPQVAASTQTWSASRPTGSSSSNGAASGSGKEDLRKRSISGWCSPKIPASSSFAIRRLQLRQPRTAAAHRRRAERDGGVIHAVLVQPASDHVGPRAAWNALAADARSGPASAARRSSPTCPTDMRQPGPSIRSTTTFRGSPGAAQ